MEVEVFLKGLSELGHIQDNQTGVTSRLQGRTTIGSTTKNGSMLNHSAYEYGSRSKLDSVDLIEHDNTPEKDTEYVIDTSFQGLLHEEGNTRTPAQRPEVWETDRSTTPVRDLASSRPQSPIKESSWNPAPAPRPHSLIKHVVAHKPPSPVKDVYSLPNYVNSSSLSNTAKQSTLRQSWSKREQLRVAPFHKEIIIDISPEERMLSLSPRKNVEKPINETNSSAKYHLLQSMPIPDTNINDTNSSAKYHLLQSMSIPDTSKPSHTSSPQVLRDLYSSDSSVNYSAQTPPMCNKRPTNTGQWSPVRTTSCSSMNQSAQWSWGSTVQSKTIHVERQDSPLWIQDVDVRYVTIFNQNVKNTNINSIST